MAIPYESIKDSVEKGVSFVEWLVDVLRGKNLIKKLLLLDVIIFVLFNPATFPTILNLLAHV